MKTNYQTLSFPHTLLHVEDDRKVTGIAAVIGNLDAHFDIIHRGAFKKTIAERGSRVRHLWQHDFDAPPIASIRNLEEVGRGDLPESIKKGHPEVKGGLLVTREYLDTPRGNEVLAGIKSDPPAIGEMSIGFDLVQYDFEEKEFDGLQAMVMNIRELRLWDTSDVNWGANHLTVAEKGLFANYDSGVSPADAPFQKNVLLSDFSNRQWDDLDSRERARIAAHFAYGETEDGTYDFTDLKLLHHEPSATGVGRINLEALKAAINELATEKSPIPIDEIHGVYAHLAKHMERYSEEPIGLEWILFKRSSWHLVNAGIETVEFDDLPIDAIQKILSSVRAEPNPQGHSLTQTALTIRKAELALLEVLTR